MYSRGVLLIASSTWVRSIFCVVTWTASATYSPAPVCFLSYARPGVVQTNHRPALAVADCAVSLARTFSLPPPAAPLLSVLLLLLLGSRHTHVAPKLPRNGTVYIVAPHDLFVSNLIPMTFFLLLLAFTDGTAQRAEVLPRRALAHLAVAGDVLVLDNSAVESYVYDGSLPPFER